MKSIKISLAFSVALCIVMSAFASTAEEVNHDSHPVLNTTRENIDRPIDRIIIPEAARGHEEDYLKFLRCTLVYKPHGSNRDEGKIEIPIGTLADPLHGTFDISRFGNAAQYIVISTGYRTEQKPEHAEKMEVWIAPRFLVEANLNGNAAHLKPMWGEWRENHEVGIFWTWGTWDHESVQEDDENEWFYPTRGRDYYDYRTDGSYYCPHSEPARHSHINGLRQHTYKVRSRLSSSALFDDEACFSRFYRPYHKILYNFNIDTSSFCRMPIT